MVGEGWGCVLVTSDRKSAWECWEAPADGTGASLSAWRVPWLDGRSMVGGAERLCTVESEEVRCFHPPRRGETAPLPSGVVVPAPDAGTTTAPTHSYLDTSALFEGLVGGTFACPSNKNDLWCAGDNSFGQLGSPSASGRRPPLLRLWITENVGLGQWHGCAYKGGGRPADEGLYCWGRNDAGQLGFAGPDSCRVEGRDVACARKPTRVPFDLRVRGLGYAPNRGKGDLRGGDLFTCARQPSGIVCWGASRDGLFGSATACPAELRRSWPTRRQGPIAAPSATCSPTPAVIAGSDRFKRLLGPTLGGNPTRPPEVTDNFDIGPRGICMVSEAGEVWCKGAIKTPRKVTATSVVVSPGENASACALTKDQQLVCWGDGYSAPKTPTRPVAITLEPLPPQPPNPNPAPVDSPGYGKPWGTTCLVRRSCERVARSIPACPAGTKGLSVEAATSLTADGRSVSVQGPLRLGGGRTTLVGCSEQDPVTGKPRDVAACCNTVTRTIIVGEGSEKGIGLDRVGCVGDESRVCCDLVVNGQLVVATGKLLPDDRTISLKPSFKLGGDIELCSLGTPPSDAGSER